MQVRICGRATEQLRADLRRSCRGWQGLDDRDRRASVQPSAWPGSVRWIKYDSRVGGNYSYSAWERVDR